MHALHPVQLFMSIDIPHALSLYSQLGNIVLSRSVFSRPSPSLANPGLALYSSSVAVRIIPRSPRASSASSELLPLPSPPTAFGLWSWKWLFVTATPHLPSTFRIVPVV